MSLHMMSSLLTISEAANPIEEWHFNDKGKHVIDESIKSFIRQHSPWKVCNRLHLVINEQLWGHHNEPYKVTMVMMEAIVVAW